MKQLIVISAPSGAGKTTIAKRILSEHSDKLTFSISATTRARREGERDGIDYYFLSREEFLQKMKANELIEYEEIFGNYYGTLVSEIERAKAANKSLIFDIDVKGGISIKARYPDDTLLIFIAPPSMEELYVRLMGRGSEDSENIDKRLDRAAMEMEMQDVYDSIIINDDLDKASKDVEKIIFTKDVA